MALVLLVLVEAIVLFSYGSVENMHASAGVPLREVSATKTLQVERNGYLKIMKRSVNSENNNIGGSNDNSGSTSVASNMTNYQGNNLNTASNLIFESAGSTGDSGDMSNSIPMTYPESTSQANLKSDNITQETGPLHVNTTTEQTVTVTNSSSGTDKLANETKGDAMSAINSTTYPSAMTTKLPTSPELPTPSKVTSPSTVTENVTLSEKFVSDSSSFSFQSSASPLNQNESSTNSTTLTTPSFRSVSVSKTSSVSVSVTTERTTFGEISHGNTTSSSSAGNPELTNGSATVSNSGNRTLGQGNSASQTVATPLPTAVEAMSDTDATNTTSAALKTTTVGTGSITPATVNESAQDTSDASDGSENEPIPEPEYNTTAPLKTETSRITNGLDTSYNVTSAPVTSVTNQTSTGSTVNKENLTIKSELDGLRSPAPTSLTGLTTDSIELNTKTAATPELNKTTTLLNKTTIAAVTESDDELVPEPTEKPTSATTKSSSASVQQVTGNSVSTENQSSTTAASSTSSLLPSSTLRPITTKTSITESPVQNETDPEPEPEETSTKSVITQNTTANVTPTPEPTNTTLTSTVNVTSTKSNENYQTGIPTDKLTEQTNEKMHSTTNFPEPSAEPVITKVVTSTPYTVKTTTVRNERDGVSEPVDKNESTTTENVSTGPPIDEITTNKPEPENGKSDPEAEQDPGSKPEGEGEPEVKEKEAFAELGPDWQIAKSMWKEAWEFHVYFFGLSFAVLGFYCLFALIRLWNIEHLLSKHYFVTLHLLVITVCVLRATYLLVDAYNSHGKFPPGVDYFLYSIAFPCITALFSILFYSLLLATRVRVLSQKVQKLWVLLLIIVFHFTLSVVTDIVAGLYASAAVMQFVCQLFFIAWGLLMFVGYLILFRKLYKGAVSHQKTLTNNSNEHKNTVGNAFQTKLKQKYTMGLAVKITFISAFFGIAITGFELYGMFGVYDVLNHERRPEPWPWWTYHIILRSLELLMCASVAYVASQPLRYRMKKNLNGGIYELCIPCSLCCCPGKLDQSEAFSSTNSLDFVVTETDHLSWLKKMRNKRSPSPQAPYPPHTAEKYSDPDATLLVRKVKRNKPSMLVVEDGFVRIRTEEEMLPSNQYELDTYSRSSYSSDFNALGQNAENGAISSVVNWNYTGSENQNLMPPLQGLNLNDYLLQGNDESADASNTAESTDDTDIEIVVTESEHESDSRESPESNDSGKSANIFRPLSMIDLAASMESELDRAFQTKCVDERDFVSGNSLPKSLDGFSVDSRDAVFSEHTFGDHCKNSEKVTDLDATFDSVDSADDRGKSSAARLLHSPVRRCKSEDNKLSSPKYKHFQKHKYFSVSSVDTLGKEEDQSIEFPDVPTSEMVTEL